MSSLPTAMTIAGSDSGGGAGIQADIKTMEALDVYATSSVTSITAQNTEGVRDIEDISPEMVGGQIEAVADDLDVSAAKTGMLSNKEIIEVVAEKVEQYNLELVVDPVMVAESGDRLLQKEAEQTIRENLLPRARLVTPNIREAEILTDIEINNKEEMKTAARKLKNQGADASLVKGGHIGEDRLTDILYTSEIAEFTKPRLQTDSNHGTGCALSSAITAELAKDKNITSAVSRAESFIHRAIKYGYEMGKGNPAVHHLVEKRNDAERFPTLKKLRGCIEELQKEDIRKLIPEVGLNLAYCTPYPLDTNDVSAIEGRMTKTTNGVTYHQGAWFGASGHMARYLLELKEKDPDITATANIRHTPKTLELVKNKFDYVYIDRSSEPNQRKEMEMETMAWVAGYIMKDRENAPEAVIDDGDVGKEAMIRLSMHSPTKLKDTIISLNNQLA